MKLKEKVLEKWNQKINDVIDSLKDCYLEGVKEIVECDAEDYLEKFNDFMQKLKEEVKELASLNDEMLDYFITYHIANSLFKDIVN